MNKTTLRKYAQLIVRCGANVQKKQEVVINCPVDQHDFALLVAEECYRAGASEVTMEWSYQPMTKLHYKKMTLKKLSEFPAWREEKLKHRANVLPAMLHILSDDPDGLNGVDFEKVSKSRQAVFPKIKPYRTAMESKYQWTIAAVPSPAWAKKVFPGERASVAVKKLWDAILATCYADGDNDTLAIWEKRNADFKKRCALLNEKKFDKLCYRSSNGTDFTVELMPVSRWGGGSDTTLGGITFNPNLPTEEVFTAPWKGRAEGRLVSTMPLSYNGALIENFEFTFHEGRVVSHKAEKNDDLLEKMITMDEGAAYLGEVALVPKGSGVAKCGVLFYETLFDENASCHIALGSGYADCMDGFENMTPDERKEKGLNDSMIHVDFMVGADDLSITGYKDGVPFEVFKNGTWAF